MNLRHAAAAIRSMTGYQRSTKVARYRRERTPKERENPAQEKPASRFLASSYLHTLSRAPAWTCRRANIRILRNSPRLMI
jgi:hypothetical protein